MKSISLDDELGLVYSSIHSRNRIARVGCTVLFVLEGFYIALWGVSLPYIQNTLGLSDSTLGVAALCPFLGTVIATPIAARLMVWLGTRFTSIFGATFFGLMLPVIVLSPNYPLLILSMLVFGIQWGICDVAANNAVVLCETVSGASYMGTCYGTYSITAAAVALTSGLLSTSGMTILNTLLMFTCIGTVLCAITAPMLYSLSQEMSISQQQQQLPTQLPELTPSSPTADPGATNISITGRSLSIMISPPLSPLHRAGGAKYEPLSLEDGTVDSIGTPSKGQQRRQLSLHRLLPCTVSISNDLLCLGCVACLSTFCEAALTCWIVIYYNTVLHVAPSARTVGFTVMMVANAIGRFSSDYLLTVFPKRAIVLCAGLAAGTGLLVVFFCSFSTSDVAVVVSTIGFALTALGFSSLGPICFSSAGHLTQQQQLVQQVPAVSPLPAESGDSLPSDRGSNHNNSSFNDIHFKKVNQEESTQYSEPLPSTQSTGSFQSHSGTAVATVALFSYSGGIAGSPVMGLLSDLTGSLRYGFLFIALMMFLIVPLSYCMPVAHHSSTASAGNHDIDIGRIQGESVLTIDTSL